MVLFYFNVFLYECLANILKSKIILTICFIKTKLMISFLYNNVMYMPIYDTVTLIIMTILMQILV